MPPNHAQAATHVARVSSRASQRSPTPPLVVPTPRRLNKGHIGNLEQRSEIGKDAPSRAASNRSTAIPSHAPLSRTPLARRPAPPAYPARTLPNDPNNDLGRFKKPEDPANPYHGYMYGTQHLEGPALAHATELQEPAWMDGRTFATPQKPSKAKSMFKRAVKKVPKLSLSKPDPSSSNILLMKTRYLNMASRAKRDWVRQKIEQDKKNGWENMNSARPWLNPNGTVRYDVTPVPQSQEHMWTGAVGARKAGKKQKKGADTVDYSAFERQLGGSIMPKAPRNGYPPPMRQSGSKRVDSGSSWDTFSSGSEPGSRAATPVSNHGSGRNRPMDSGRNTPIDGGYYSQTATPSSHSRPTTPTTYTGSSGRSTPTDGGPYSRTTTPATSIGGSGRNTPISRKPSFEPDDDRVISSSSAPAFKPGIAAQPRVHAPSSKSLKRNESTNVVVCNSDGTEGQGYDGSMPPSPVGWHGQGREPRRSPPEYKLGSHWNPARVPAREPATEPVVS